MRCGCCHKAITAGYFDELSTETYCSLRCANADLGVEYVTENLDKLDTDESEDVTFFWTEFEGVE